MYRSFTISGFRGFRDLTVEGLQRINLIGGMNSVGKTAFLEALFLHAGPANPGLPFALNALRGQTRYALEPEELWGWLFLDRDIDRTIALESTSDDRVRRTLEINLSTVTTTELPRAANGAATGPPGSLSTTAGARELRLRYRDSKGVVGESVASVVDGTVKGEAAALPGMPSGIYLGTFTAHGDEDLTRFSKLERAGRQDEILTALRLLEPRLRRLSILTLGGMTGLHGDLGIGSLVPLHFMGEGITRLLAILLAVLSAPGGVVLVDEIGNGLHYSVMPAVWRVLARAARGADVQLFATTHSWDCIKAAHAAFDQDETYDLKLLRFDRVGDAVEAVAYDRETLGASIEMGLEVR